MRRRKAVSFLFYSVCQKGFAEFAARQGGEQVESFFAATCAWQKYLARREYLFAYLWAKSAGRSESYLSKKGYALFDKLNNLFPFSMVICAISPVESPLICASFSAM